MQKQQREIIGERVKVSDLVGQSGMVHSQPVRGILEEILRIAPPSYGDQSRTAGSEIVARAK